MTSPQPSPNPLPPRPVRLSLDTPGLATTYDQLGHRQFNHGQFADVDELLAFNISSSFGNALAGLDEARRATVRASLDRALDAHRLPDGSLQLQRHLIFAVARKD